jgi:ubiquinone/menaquinone biosynthesis C-methylase UbiE
MTIDLDSETTGSAAFSTASEVETYREANRRLVEMADVHDAALVLDVGCGPGVVLELLLELSKVRAAWGVDPDPEMVAEARRRLGPGVGVIQGSADDVADLFPAAAMDVVFMANCIHLFDDPTVSLRRVQPVMAPGGRIAINTGMFDGAAPQEDRLLYLRLLLQARRLAGERAHSSRSRPHRGHAARRELSEDYLGRALEAAGFRITEVEHHTVILPKEFLMSLVSTPMFAQSVLPRLDPDVAGAVMKEALASLIAPFADDLQDNERAGLRRNWLYIVATRTTE